MPLGCDRQPEGHTTLPQGSERVTMSPRQTLIPSVTFQVMEGDQPRSISSREVFSGRSVALFGVPGAFMPACHHIHIPEIIGEYERNKSDGVDLVALTAVNDVFVLEAWRRSLS